MSNLKGMVMTGLALLALPGVAVGMARGTAPTNGDWANVGHLGQLAGSIGNGVVEAIADFAGDAESRRPLPPAHIAPGPVERDRVNPTLGGFGGAQHHGHPRRPGDGPTTPRRGDRREGRSFDELP